MAGAEPDILRIKTPSSIDSIGAFTLEERGRTFVVSQPADEVGGASDIELVIENDTDRIMRIVNAKFEARESRIKDEIRSEFEDRIRKIERSHELSVRHLKRELSNLSKVSLECEYLKTLQTELRAELEAQNEKIRKLTRENQKLKSMSKSNTLADDTDRLKEENDKLKEENQKREHEINKLSKFITQKELEIATLKTQIDIQYKKIKLDLTNTRDKFRHEHFNLNEGMKKQELMLSEITEAVKHISKTKDEASKQAKGDKSTKEHTGSKKNTNKKTSKEETQDKSDKQTKVSVQKKKQNINTSDKHK